MSMGIYIKNMKAPVNCCHCPLIGYDPDIEWNDGGRETQGAYVCVLTGELIDNTKREEHCPLVPVPPHGRLIDADGQIGVNVTMMPGGKCKVDLIAPTVIEAEEDK